MKNMLFSLVVVVLAFSFMAFYSGDDSKYEYVGVKKCGMCHKKEKDGDQLAIWEKSKHSEAYKTLTTEEADKVAKEAGYDTPAAETDFCLKCHVTGHDLPAEKMQKSFDMKDGVQCETCHGPGSEYKSIKIMKDHDASVANGMTDYPSMASIEKQCVTCHNEESPTYKPFNFEEKWEQIQHYVPGEK